MADAIDKAVRAQGGAVVKPHQVKAMVLAARRAYKVQADAGLVDDGLGFDAWRRATLHDVVGAAAPDSFRAVTQRDYAGVMDYFGRLGGSVVRSLGSSDHPTTKRPNHQTRNEDEVRRALWALGLAEGETARAFGGREGARRYADALFEKIHRTVRSAATARQVWAVIFTLRSRAASRRAKTAIESRGAQGVPLSPPQGSERFPAFSRGF